MVIKRRWRIGAQLTGILVTKLQAIAVDIRSVTIAWNTSLEYSNESIDKDGAIDTCFVQYSEDSVDETDESQGRHIWTDHS